MRVDALNVALAVPWAMQPEALHTLLQIAAREGAGPEAVAAQLGHKLDNTRTVKVRGGVAVVPVVGPIFRRANLLTSVSGATSIEVLAQDLSAALEDPSVSSILLEIDSPGGEANGVSEMAAMIAHARSKKPVHAYVGGIGASGAYWLASAAETVTVAPTGMLGSIGTVMGFKKGDGSEVEFVSSQSPHKRPDLETDAGKAQIQGLLDTLAGVFISDVARYRGVSAATVESDFGRGGLLIGKDAVKAGMADAVGSFEGLVRKLKSGRPPARKTMTTSLPDGGDAPGAEDASGGLVAELAASEDEESGMSQELDTLRADLAAAQAKAADAEVRYAEAESTIRTLTTERDSLQAVATAALDDQRNRYLGNRLKVGGEATQREATLIAEMLVSSGDYARLKELADGAEAEAAEKLPVGVSADLKGATKAPAAALNAADEATIAKMATERKISVEEMRQQFLAVRAGRHSGAAN